MQATKEAKEISTLDIKPNSFLIIRVSREAEKHVGLIVNKFAMALKERGLDNTVIAVPDDFRFEQLSDENLELLGLKRIERFS